MRRTPLIRPPIGLFVCLLLISSTPTFGQYISVSADSLAVDQPRVLFLLEDPITEEEVGPPFFNEALLDTGANGLLLFARAYFDFDFLGVNPNYYTVAQRDDGSRVQYEEIGVAGTEFLDVLVPHNLYFGGSDGAPFQLPSVNILGAPQLDAGSFAGLIGMPAMMGRVTTMDMRPLAAPEFIGVAFSQSLSAPTPNSYNVPLYLLPPEHTGQVEPGDPLPTFAPVPLIDVRHEHGSLESSARVLLDTGAQTSIIFSQTAHELGINIDPNDPNNDIIGYLEVGGIGGTVEMPFVALDRWVVPTAEGVDLVFTDLQVGVLDIDVEGLEGVMGMNILASGWFDAAFGSAEHGVFDQVMLDFTLGDEFGVMRFEINPAYNVVIPEPGLLALLPAALYLTALRRRRR